VKPARIAKLEGDDIFYRTMKPAGVFPRLKQNGHAIVEGLIFSNRRHANRANGSGQKYELS
jgi:hypothetical protein